MFNSITISPQNSLLFLSDEGGGVPPVPVWGAQILATPSCISFACYPWQDGPTNVVLGPRREVDPAGEPAFKGELETPRRSLIVTTVDDKIVLRARVIEKRTPICIWLSHPRWPDRVIIGYG